LVAFWFWFFTGPAILLALLSLRGERRKSRYVAARLAESSEWLPRATVIVPVKGFDDGLRENLDALASLDYPDYELIVTAHSAADIPPGVLPPRVRVVLAHGADAATGEKIQNLQAAVRAASKRSQVFAFADSDGHPTPRWLRALVAPLADEQTGASTGYRWFTPHPATFAGLLRSVWDGVCVSMLGAGDCGFVWGGAMAMRKETFFEARVFKYWKNTISDDYALASAVRAAGMKIAYAPGALVPCIERLSLGRFLSWARRQMTITRVYSPKIWWPGLIAHIFYCGGMAAPVIAAARGHWSALWALALQLPPGMWKGWNRARQARTALPERDRWFRKWGWVHALWTPLATWTWLVVLLSSAGSNTIVWRGYRHELRRPPVV